MSNHGGRMQRLVGRYWWSRRLGVVVALGNETARAPLELLVRSAFPFVEMPRRDCGSVAQVRMVAEAQACARRTLLAGLVVGRIGVAVLALRSAWGEVEVED